MSSCIDNLRIIKKLKDTYIKHNNLIIGVDFDDTIFDLKEIGLDCSRIIELLYRCQNAGLTLCMWTVVNNEWDIIYKKWIAKTMGINFKYFNESPIKTYGAKPFFNILLDDSAGLSSAYEILTTTLNELNL